MAGIFDPYNYNALGGFVGLGNSPSPLFSSLAPPVKRKAFFSFRFDDVMRVNVVRNAWKIAYPDNAWMCSFYDSSLWESGAREGPDSMRQLIRDGAKNTSAVCVLIGSETWSRRWVRYEIAGAIIDGRGLVAVHLNGINHHETRTPHANGPNPLAYMAVGKVQLSLLGAPIYYLIERTSQGWFPYQDHTTAVSLPSWLADPDPGYVMPLSSGADEYDYILHDGHKNIGDWIDRAAQKAGR
jgi:MTH538 TIR-like domain (DUF1863)